MGDSNKFPRQMFPVVLNTIFLDISKHLSQLGQRNFPYSYFCRSHECQYKEGRLYREVVVEVLEQTLVGCNQAMRM